MLGSNQRPLPCEGSTTIGWRVKASNRLRAGVSTISSIIDSWTSASALC